MKRIIYLFTLLPLLFGCTEDIMEQQLLNQATSTTRSAGDRQFDLLGYGYDVTGDYFTTRSARSRIIDIATFKKENEGRFDYNLTPDSYGLFTSGTSAEDFTSNLTAHASLSPNFKLFSGSLEVSFEGSQHYSSKYSIASYSLFMRRKQLYITAPIELLSQYLTSSFKEDVNTQSAEYIIKNYGTHVLTNITLGARLTIMYRSSITSSKKAETIKAGCKFNIMKVFGIDVGGHYDQTLLKDNFEQELTYRTIGGDPSKALVGNLNLSAEAPPTVDILAWQSTCDTLNMSLIDVLPGSSIPIYELVMDSNKKQELKKAVENYMREKSFIDFGEPTPLYRYTFDSKIWIALGGQGPTTDYYYTADYSEYEKGNNVFTLDKTVCYVYPVTSHPTASIPLYEYTYTFNSRIGRSAYFYTTKKSNYHKCEFRRIVCYVYASENKPKNSIPLYETEILYFRRSVSSGQFFHIDENEKIRLPNSNCTINDLSINNVPCYVMAIPE